MKNENPAFAFIARTNSGKSTMAATLSMNEDVYISDGVNTTSISDHFKPKDTNLSFWDTPGFSESSNMLKELQNDGLWKTPLGKKRIKEFYEKYKEHNKDKKDNDKKYKYEIELLRPIIENNAAIIFIVIGTMHYQENHYIFKELEILGYTGQPIYIFVNEKPRFLGEDINEKAKENIHTWIEKLRVKFRVLKFNPMEADYINNMKIFDALKLFVNPWETDVESAKKSIQRTYCSMIEDNADIVVQHMKKILTVEKVAYVKKNDKLPNIFQDILSKYQEEIIQVEKDTHINIQEAWEHTNIAETKNIDIDHIFSKDKLEFINAIDSKTGQVAGIGAMIGLSIDVISLGATLGAGTVLGGGLGTLLGKQKSLIIKTNTDDNGKAKYVKETIHIGGKNYMPKEFDILMLNRILAYSIETGSRSHANHEEIKIENNIDYVVDPSIKYTMGNLHEKYRNDENSTDIDDEYRKIILDILLKEITQDDLEMKKIMS